jgi:hypothetical protein
VSEGEVGAREVRRKPEGGGREAGGGVAKVTNVNNNKYKKWLSFLGTEEKPPSIGSNKFRYGTLSLGMGLD